MKKNENPLINLVKETGSTIKIRKRISGAAAQVTYKSRDQYLIKRHRLKQDMDQEGVNISKDKVTSKGLIRQGQLFYPKAKSKEPSEK